MRAFIKHIDTLHAQIHLCYGSSLKCKRRTRNPCQYCIKLPPNYELRMFMEHLHEKLGEIVEVYKSK